MATNALVLRNFVENNGSHLEISRKEVRETDCR